jgi:hypothetical protein
VFYRQTRLAIATGLAVGLFAMANTLALAAPNLMAGIAALTPTPEGEPATFAITVRTCPPGYDPRSESADYLVDCRESAGDTMFALALAGSTASGPSASTGTSGDAPQEATVTFSGLAAGRYTAAATAPPEIASAFIGACQSDARDFSGYPFVPFAVAAADGTVVLSLEPGETLACDWYQIAGTGAPIQS